MTNSANPGQFLIRLKCQYLPSVPVGAFIICATRIGLSEIISQGDPDAISILKGGDVVWDILERQNI